MKMDKELNLGDKKAVKVIHHRNFNGGKRGHECGKKLMPLVKEHEFDFLFHGISVSSSMVGENTISIDFHDENTLCNSDAVKGDEGAFVNHVEEIMRILSDYRLRLKKSIRGVDEAIDMMARMYLENGAVLTDEEKSRFTRNPEEEKKTLESLFERVFNSDSLE